VAVPLVLAAAVVTGAVVSFQPPLAIAVTLVGFGALLSLACNDVAMMAVVFVLYSNAAVVAVHHHGLPYPIAAAVPLLLGLPLTSYLVFLRKRVLVTRALPLIAAFVAVQAVGSLFSFDVRLSAPYLATSLVEGLILYLLLTNVVRTMTALRRVVWMIVLASALMGGLTVYQEMTGRYDDDFAGFAQVSNAAFRTGSTTMLGDVEQPRLAGPIGEQNRFAQVLLMAFPLAMVQMSSERRAVLRAVALVAALVIGLGTMLTFSRGAAVGFALLILIMACLRYIRPVQLAALVVGAALLLRAFPEYATRLSSVSSVLSVASGQQAASELEGPVRSRLTENLAALRVSLDYPLVGVGPGMFRHYYHQYAEGGLRVLSENRQAHNLYLGLAAEHGWLGLGLFVAVLVVTLVDLARARGREGRADMATAFVLAIVAYLTTGVFLQLSYVRYFWLMMALAAVVPHVETGADSGQAAAAVPSTAVVRQADLRTAGESA
jgi:hypothetical protein